MAIDVNKKGGGFLIGETDPETVFTPEDFSEEQKMFAKTAEDFLQNEVFPNIEKTEAKDREIRRLAEKVITRGKGGSLHDRRLAAAVLTDEGVVRKVFEERG